LPFDAVTRVCRSRLIAAVTVHASHAGRDAAAARLGIAGNGLRQLAQAFPFGARLGLLPMPVGSAAEVLLVVAIVVEAVNVLRHAPACLR
jgi:hypothetical protein